MLLPDWFTLTEKLMYSPKTLTSMTKIVTAKTIFQHHFYIISIILPDKTHTHPVLCSVGLGRSESWLHSVQLLQSSCDSPMLCLTQQGNRTMSAGASVMLLWLKASTKWNFCTDSKEGVWKIFHIRTVLSKFGGVALEMNSCSLSTSSNSPQLYFQMDFMAINRLTDIAVFFWIKRLASKQVNFTTNVSSTCYWWTNSTKDVITNVTSKLKLLLEGNSVISCFFPPSLPLVYLVCYLLHHQCSTFSVLFGWLAEGSVTPSPCVSSFLITFVSFTFLC